MNTDNPFADINDLISGLLDVADGKQSTNSTEPSELGSGPTPMEAGTESQPTTVDDDELSPRHEDTQAPASAVLQNDEPDPIPGVDFEIPSPTFTTEELVNELDIRDYATLVTFSSTRWTAKVKDAKARRDIAAANDADESAFETYKHLLSGADAKLQAINKHLDAARQRHYSLTLPWSTGAGDDASRRSGARLLLNSMFYEYIQGMAEHKQAVDKAVADFVPEYPALVQQAQKNLGKRFDPMDYPSASDIAGRFTMVFDFHPVPSSDGFRGLAEQQVAALSAALQKKNAVMMENALQDAYQRFVKTIAHMAERLRDPNKKFHFTLMENVRNATRQLKHFNFIGHPDMEAAQKYAEDNLCGFETDALRSNNTTRATAAKLASELLVLIHNQTSKEV